VSLDLSRPQQLIWATRGRSWGFRFLLDAGINDPLQDYEQAFRDLRDAPTAWRRAGGHVALRVPDPLGRRDAAGRIIPHEFVIFGDMAEHVDSVEDGLSAVWPLLANAYAAVWDSTDPPTAQQLRFDAP
jgi:hypothetical protein